ncbi:DUF2497 domain-containing protein [Hyphococcus luteus]|uniref:DUF2497 domain-containing protein n=1 Tax=Hyphococcus luteus TaxID=2058213 RepID=A0A2S7K105_9PROT|nr:DUF2497 domain-containing protein [Marinicaulis flavus]PQA86192.1 DUF2497 domain-containing protein [Marinicaulis flavus]
MDNAQPEPSMEEILASIRRIISEDEDDQAKPAAAAPPSAAAAPKPELTLKPAAPAADHKPAAEASGQPQESKPAPEPETSAAPDAVPAPAEAQPETGTEDVEGAKKTMAATMQDEIEDEILDQTTAAAASKAFTTLSQSVRVSEGPGRTLEDIVTEMLRPMVKEWLDANLPAIVEEKVEEEVQRVARRRRS